MLVEQEIKIEVGIVNKALGLISDAFGANEIPLIEGVAALEIALIEAKKTLGIDTTVLYVGGKTADGVIN